LPHSRIYSPVRDKNHKFIFKSSLAVKNDFLESTWILIALYEISFEEGSIEISWITNFETDSLIRVKQEIWGWLGDGGSMNENFADEKLSVHRNRDWISVRSSKICIKLWVKIYSGWAWKFKQIMMKKGHRISNMWHKLRTLSRNGH
jgi:hypothetical protein